MDISLDGEAKVIHIDWPQGEGVTPTHRVTIEHLEDNDELIILVDDSSSDSQPECIWSSVGVQQ